MNERNVSVEITIKVGAKNFSHLIEMPEGRLGSDEPFLAVVEYIRAQIKEAEVETPVIQRHTLASGKN